MATVTITLSCQTSLDLNPVLCRLLDESLLRTSSADTTDDFIVLVKSRSSGIIVEDGKFECKTFPGEVFNIERRMKPSSTL